MSEGSDGTAKPQDDPGNPLDQLAQLRELLAIPERRQVQRIEKQLTELTYTAAEVARLLPEAITLKASDPDKALLLALTPVIEETLHTAVQRDRQRVADLLYPIIGPAIRKSIAEALTGFVQSLNQVLENSLSVRGFLWRLEAMRTGVSFGEVVLRNNLLYRVEQVFLIHQHTGLPMQHLVAPEVIAQDSSLVSGMLTALQDFVRDSFTGPQGDGLAMLKVGELNVWIEQGPQAILAAVLRGSAPESLRSVLRATLENLHVRFATELATFAGDDSTLLAARPLLEACMTAQYKPKVSRPSPALIFIVLGVVLGGGSWGYAQWQKAVQWDSYVSRLRAEHGIVINSQGRHRGRYYVTGLRDPLATDPLKLLKDSGLKPAQVSMTWEEYQAMFPEFLQARARAVLLPPPEITLTLQGRILTAAGRASHHWLITARRLAPVIPGVAGYQDSTVEDLDVTTVAQERAAIERTRLLFPPLVATVTPAMNEPLAQLARHMHRLLTAVLVLDGMVQIRIIGHANYFGTDETAQLLSRQRADQVAEALRARSIPFPILVPVGVATASSAGQPDDPSERRVSFQVELFSPNLYPEQSP